MFYVPNSYFEQKVFQKANFKLPRKDRQNRVIICAFVFTPTKLDFYGVPTSINVRQKEQHPKYYLISLNELFLLTNAKR